MKDDKFASKYIEGKLSFYFDITDHAIDLPQIEDQDERLNALQVVTSASPQQAKEVEKQLSRHMTNWQMHQHHERIKKDKLQQRDVNAQNRIDAIDKYVAYARKRGFSNEYIAEIVSQIWKAME